VPKPVLHSYTENTGEIVSIKRKKMSELISESKHKEYEIKRAKVVD
jgi:hypothetical protein